MTARRVRRITSASSWRPASADPKAVRRNASRAPGVRERRLPWTSEREVVSGILQQDTNGPCQLHGKSLRDAFPPRPSDGVQMANIQRFVKEPNPQECFCYCTNGSSFPFSCQCPREDLREAMEVLRAALHPSVAHRPGAHGLRPAVPSRGAGVAGRHLSAVSGLDPL